MKIGYAHVSMEEQRLAVQLDALRKAGCKRIVQEKVSGAGRERPELVRLPNQLREGDVVVVTGSWEQRNMMPSTTSCSVAPKSPGRVGGS
jgi:nitrogen regulatory protein PII